MLITLKSKPLLILIASSFLSTLAIFLIIPIISLHAFESFKLSETQVGLVAGIWPATVFMLSFLAGMLADQYGYLPALKFAVLANGMAFLVLAFSGNAHSFAFGLFLFGLGKSFFDSTIRASIITLCVPADRERIFRFRYLMQNIACVIGPLLGVFFYHHVKGRAFLAPSAIYFLILALMLALPSDALRRVHSEEALKFFAKLKVMRNRSLLCWIASGTLIFMAYGAYESFMPIVAVQSNGLRPSFGILVSLNAVVVVALQAALLKWLKHLPLLFSILAGFTLMVLGFGCFASNFSQYGFSILGVILFSAGEAFLFPCFEILMDQIAPEKQKALFYGAGETKQIGFFMGPFCAGLVMDNFGYQIAFACCAAWISLAAAFFYFARPAKLSQ